MRKSKSLPTTEAEWLARAFAYCERRETSRPKLKRYLLRVEQVRNGDTEASAKVLSWIENALDACERERLIDHERFAGILTREYERQGKSKNYISQMLIHQGVKEESFQFETEPEVELTRAVRLASKIASQQSFKKIKDHELLRLKLLQKLMISGFDSDLAKRAADRALTLPEKDLNLKG